MTIKTLFQQAGTLLLAYTLLTWASTGAAATQFIALGTQGGPQPNPYRAQPAHAIQINGETYLIDAGNGISRQLAMAGIPVETVKKVFISHNHDDHNADLGTLMGFSWSLNNKGKIDVFGPAGTEQAIDGFLNFYEINAAIRKEDSPLPQLGKFSGGVAVHNIGKASTGKEIYKDKNIIVSAIENCHFHHDEPVKNNGGIERSYAFRFETEDRTIVFSGDTGPCPQLAEFSKGADLLVHEVLSSPLLEQNIRSNRLMVVMPQSIMKALIKKSELYHTVPEEVGKLAANAGVGEVLLTHVMPGNASDPDSAYTNGVSLHYQGKVIVAKDLGIY